MPSLSSNYISIYQYTNNINNCIRNWGNTNFVKQKHYCYFLDKMQIMSGILKIQVLELKEKPMSSTKIKNFKTKGSKQISP